jgi:hypothetical protein
MLDRTKLVCLIAALGAGTAVAQDKPAAGAPAMDAKKAAEMQKYMEASVKAATPGPEHEKLKAMAGTFDVKTSMWVEPNKPPMESTGGTATNKMILGDRFLMQEFSGTFMGEPLNGMVISGYDNLKKKYTSMSIDSQMTSMLTGEGTAEKDGTFTFSTDMIDVITGKVSKGKVLVKPSGTGYTTEVWGPPKGGKGKHWKFMEMTFTKK